MAEALRGTRALGSFLAEERCVYRRPWQRCRFCSMRVYARALRYARPNRSALQSRRAALVTSATAALESAMSSEIGDVEVVDHALAKYAKYAADCGERSARTMPRHRDSISLRRSLLSPAERMCGPVLGL